MREGQGSHVGVVVGFLAEVLSTPTEARLWWDNVLVVSTRAGFQMANLGTWGNRGGIFGGFAEDPEDYVIRRLVRKTGSSSKRVLGMCKDHLSAVVYSLHRVCKGGGRAIQNSWIHRKR